jgi:hypothetical protein
MSVVPRLLRGGWSVGELAGRGRTHLGSHPISLEFRGHRRSREWCGVEDGYTLW